ncbi:MAG: acetyltransferase [Lachnospiraceae bacterium]|nr:acetyltransferase [Lachnospiraceae bacterium]
MRNLYIIGAGGFGREVAWLVERINQKELLWNIKGFIDDDSSIFGMTEDNYNVIGGCDYLKALDDDYWVVCAVGNAKTRKTIVEKIKGYRHLHFATVIDPDVKISERTKIGEGTIICVGSIITVDVEIGKHCIINLDCTIGHDAVLKDYVTLYPSVNVSGRVNIADKTEIGTGAHIIQGINIGSGVIIGAGATVIKDIEDEVTVVGNPAKVIKKHSAGNFGGVLRKADKVFFYLEESHYRLPKENAAA